MHLHYHYLPFFSITKETNNNANKENIIEAFWVLVNQKTLHMEHIVYSTIKLTCARKGSNEIKDIVSPALKQTAYIP